MFWFTDFQTQTSVSPSISPFQNSAPDDYLSPIQMNEIKPNYLNQMMQIDQKMEQNDSEDYLIPNGKFNSFEMKPLMSNGRHDEIVTSWFFKN